MLGSTMNSGCKINRVPEGKAWYKIQLSNVLLKATESKEGEGSMVQR